MSVLVGQDRTVRDGDVVIVVDLRVVGVTIIAAGEVVGGGAGMGVLVVLGRQDVDAVSVSVYVPQPVRQAVWQGR